MIPWSTTRLKSCLRCISSGSTAGHPIKRQVKTSPFISERFYTENVRERILHKTSQDVYGLYCDYEGDHTKPYSLLIGCQTAAVEAAPNGMVSKTIPASTYAVFSAVGPHPQALIETWGEIWKTDLKRTYTGDFEYYDDNFAYDKPTEVKVFIAIVAD